MQLAKDIFTIVGGIIGLVAFVKGVIELVHSNAIHRYEKFHQMSVRFDENEDIQKVCALLHDAGHPGTLTKQQKEVFICFLEEIQFMINSGIMKRDLALYTFGYYGKMAMESEKFWQELNRNEPFYAHFMEFCNQARSYQPTSAVHRRALAY